MIATTNPSLNSVSRSPATPPPSTPAGHPHHRPAHLRGHRRRRGTQPPTPRRHRGSRRPTYYWSLAGVFATTTVLGVMRWPEDAHLLVLGICSFAAASAGRLAWRRQGTWHLPGGWAISHITGMSGSHIVLLTAFYPNNA